MPTPTPVPVAIVSELPEWLTGIAVPIAAAVLAALIVVAGLAIDMKRRDRMRRSTFVDELSQLLIASAKSIHTFGVNEEDVIREGMATNVHRVRAASQMKRREFPVYLFASWQATEVLNGHELTPQAATALAIEHLLEWLKGERKSRSFADLMPDERPSDD